MFPYCSQKFWTPVGPYQIPTHSLGGAGIGENSKIRPNSHPYRRRMSARVREVMLGGMRGNQKCRCITNNNLSTTNFRLTLLIYEEATSLSPSRIMKSASSIYTLVISNPSGAECMCVCACKNGWEDRQRKRFFFTRQKRAKTAKGQTFPCLQCVIQPC